MSKSLHFSMLFFFLLSFIKGNAQCVQVLTDEPLEVCSSGGTTINVGIAGNYFAVEWTPDIGLDNPKILNPTFLNPIDTTYLLTFTGLDEETQDTCETKAYIEIKTVQFDLILPQDTVELPCGDSIRLPAQVLPSESYFITEWTTTTGNFVQGNQIINPLIDATGIYQLSAIGTLGRIVCEAKDSLEVIYATDNQLAINPPDHLHCNQSSVTLSLATIDTTDSFLYSWTTTDGNFTSETDQAIVVVDKKGEYEVTRTDLFGDCKVSQTVNIEAIELEDFDLTVGQPSCDNPTGTITIDKINGGVAPYTYSKDNGVSFQNSNEFSNVDQGDYAILVKDANNCELLQETSILPFPSFELSLISKMEVERGSEFILPLTIENQQTDIESIEWQSTFGLSCTDCQNPSIMDFRNTAYTVLVKGKNGCTQEASIDIIITQPNLFFAPTIFSPNGDGQNDLFTIFTNNKIANGLTELAIFDRYGNLVFQKTKDSAAQTAQWNGKYKGKEMPNGTYIYWGEIALINGETERVNGTINLIK